MHVLSFQNEGVVDIAAFTTFGVSAKADASAIGFFGTGFKYATAIILRLGGKVTLYQGTQPYEFGLTTREIRGERFNIVNMNGQDLGYTTHLGTSWEPWMAFRELYCNAIDEGGKVQARRLAPRAGMTTIHVSCPAIMDAYERRGEYILHGHPQYQLAHVDAHHGKSQHIYYRGIRVGKLPRPSNYTYNITVPVSLTEDRTLRYGFLADQAVIASILRSGDREFITKAITDPSCYEANLSFTNTVFDPEPAFLNIIGELRRSHPGTLPESIVGLHLKHRPDDCADDTVQPTPEELDRISSACDAINRRLGYKIKHPIDVVSTLGPGIYGRAAGGKIKLSRRAFQAGQRILIGTIIEEYLHLEFGFADESRDFQNFLIDIVAGLVEVHK